MRLYFVSSAVVFLTAVFMIVGRETLAGESVRAGDLIVTERNVPWEDRLYLIGGVLGALGIIILFVGVSRIESSNNRDKPQ